MQKCNRNQRQRVIQRQRQRHVHRQKTKKIENSKHMSKVAYHLLYCNTLHDHEIDGDIMTVIVSNDN